MNRWLGTALAIACTGAGGCTDEPASSGPGAPPALDDASEADAHPGPEQSPPEPPPSLQRWLTGNPDDAEVVAEEPALILAGGGADVDAAFAWAVSRAPQADVVVLRASGADGYNDYLFSDIGGIDSVETLLVDDRALADSAYVAWALDRAELIFIAGGDQWRYLEAWRGTEVQRALADAWQRNATIGGTSAGCAILGDIAFSAENGSAYSDEVLADPFDSRLRLEAGFADFPPLAGLITDTHFAERDRMGRLLAFLARAYTDESAASPYGLGIGEGTAVLVRADGTARVVGDGAAYLVVPSHAPESCVAGQPLTFTGSTVYALEHGSEFDLVARHSTGASTTVSVNAGTIDPADPY